MIWGLQRRLLVLLMLPLGLVALVSVYLHYQRAGTAALQQDQQLLRLVPLLVDSVVVAAVDRYGNPVPGATVDWTAVDGSVSPAQSVADARGYARTSWTHATFGGPQYLLAGVPGGTPVTITGRYGNPNIGVRIELPIRPDEDHPTFLRFGDSLRVEATSSAAASATAYFNGASAPLALVSGRWRGGIPATQANGLDTIAVWVRNAAGTDSARDVRPFLLQRALRVHLSQPLSLTGEPYYPFPGGAPGPTYNAPSSQVRSCRSTGIGTASPAARK